MLVTRVKIVTKKITEDWSNGETYLDEANNDDYPGACINIGAWTNRIVCYGHTEDDANTLRRFILDAVKEYNGV